MPRATLILEILRPSKRAEQLVAAVAAELGVEPERGDDLARFRVDGMAYPVAHQRVKRTLSRSNDPGGEVVRILEGQ